MTISNTLNLVTAATAPIPGNFAFTQQTAGTDACPIVGTSQTSTFSYISYDADGNLLPAGALGASYRLWNDGGNASSFSASGNGGSSSAGSGVPISTATGSVTVNYNGSGTDVTAFETFGENPQSYFSGPTQNGQQGGFFGITPINSTSRRGHYAFVDDASGNTYLVDICKRSQTGPDATLMPPSLDNPVGTPVIDTSAPHMFEVYRHSGSPTGQVGFYDYSFPNFTPTGSNTPPLIGSLVPITQSGTPTSAAYGKVGTQGYLYVTMGTPDQIVSFTVNETTGLTAGTSVSGNLNGPDGIIAAGSNVYVANQSANTVSVFTQGTLGFVTPLTVVNHPTSLAATSDGAYVAATATNNGTTTISIIQTAGPSVQTTLTAAGSIMGISFTAPVSTGACASGSTSGVLAVLESSQLEYFNGATYKSGGTVGPGNACATLPSGSLSSASVIGASSNLTGLVWTAGVITNTYALQAANRADGFPIFTTPLPALTGGAQYGITLSL